MDVTIMKTLEDAYLILLQMGSPLRFETKTQVAMIQVRNALAELTGRSEQDVQDHYAVKAQQLISQRQIAKAEENS